MGWGGLTGTQDVYIRTLPLYNQFPGMRQQPGKSPLNTEVSFSREKFDFLRLPHPSLTK